MITRLKTETVKLAVIWLIQKQLANWNVPNKLYIYNSLVDEYWIMVRPDWTASIYLNNYKTIIRSLMSSNSIDIIVYNIIEMIYDGQILKQNQNLSI